VEESCDGDPDSITDVPLPAVSTAVLAKIIEFCEHYKLDPMKKIERPLKSMKIEELVQDWYVNFIDTDPLVLVELAKACNYMNVEPLLDLTCFTVARLIQGKNDEEVKSMFGFQENETSEEADSKEEDPN